MDVSTWLIDIMFVIPVERLVIVIAALLTQNSSNNQGRFEKVRPNDVDITRKRINQRVSLYLNMEHLLLECFVKQIYKC